MRARKTDGSFSVHAIAGTYVVLFGFDIDEADCVGLKGFSVHRADLTENEAYYFDGQKAFEKTDPGLSPGSTYSTKAHPIQSFLWSDYTAKPEHRYVYTFTALKGEPEALIPFKQVVLEVETEGPEAGKHDIYFNRGVAASQAYAKRFGNRPPDQVPNRKAFDWLSRGLVEAMKGFVLDDAGPRRAFRIAAYEFHYGPFLEALKLASDRGSDIRIIYDARKEEPRDKNRAAVADAKIGGLVTERQNGKSKISHNKFIVRLTDGVPDAVWTGGTNFSEGGIFGHSNVAHVIQDPDIAQKFLDYWLLLEADPENGELKPQVDALSPLPEGEPPVGVMPIFSPRGSLDALDWYANLAASAKQGLFMTFAFGISDAFQKVYADGKAPLRFALLEKKTRSMPKGSDREAAEKKIDDLRKKRENVFAIGSLIPNNKLDGWLAEKLSGVNRNVNYIHNKFMLIDPLSEDPIVIAGSANFSVASTDGNDENMVVVRGDKRTADIYLGEFMRLYSHHAFRESLGWREADSQPKYLRVDDWWKDYFGNNSRSARRVFFK
jgi:phosphatidylserine/phosphatidylglycerophosphate/cardiolipin synthase-like enzyme